MSRVQRTGTAIVMALLAVGFPALVAAQVEGGPQQGGPYREVEPMVTVTGMVQANTDGDGWILVEQESGDSIVLKGKKKKVGAEEGSNVMLTGRWSKGDPSTKIFRVSKVEAAPAAAAPAVADPASPESPAAEAPAAEAPAAESPATEPATPESTESPAPDATQSPAPEAAPAPESPESAAPETPETPAPQP